MSQKKGGGKSYFPGSSIAPAKGKVVGGQISGGSGAGNKKAEVLQLGSSDAELSLDSGENTEWEVVSRNKNRGGAGAGAPKQRGVQNSVSKSRGPGKATGGAWQDARPGGRGNTKSQSSTTGWETNYMAPPAKIAPPLQHGWQWGARGVQVQPNAVENVEGNTDFEDDEDMIEDSDDDFYYDGFDSNKSHETCKKNKWFKKFFDTLDKLSLDETNSSMMQWHCPACRNGPGEINWYNGLQPLMAHAKTKGSKRVKLHREFAELLDEELRRKGTSVIPVGEVYGEWHGLRQSVSDKEIVWPPMVVVMNTQLAKDENEKWTGMGSTQLLGYFGAYNALKARHSYGPKGHRGMSLLIFEGNPTGHVEAERLHNHFVKEGRDRDAWDHHRTLFYPGGLRILYGFIASKEDMDSFNYHSKDKSKLKFEMRSYEKMVVSPMKQMSKDNQQLKWLQIKAAKNQRHTKAMEETVEVLSERLRKTAKENRIVRERTLLQYEQNKEELDQQEQFFKAQIEKIRQTLVEKERVFQEEQAECRKKQLNDVDSALHANKEIEKFIESQSKGIESTFQAEKESLFQLHEEKKAELKHQRLQEDVNLQHKRLQEDVDLEKKLYTSLTELMSRYSSQSSGGI